MDEFVKFTVEYKSLSQKQSYVKFEINDSLMFTISESALRSNGLIGSRKITKEPMSIIFNMGLSKIWNPKLQVEDLQLPAKFYIDYIRIYQPSDAIDLTCDPDDFPTSVYIQSHANAYTNWELNTWNDAGYEFPRNSLENKCRSPSMFGPS
ncbi:Kre62 subunit of glucan synthase [Candida orthopsilosis Co 90-125]|uniref:Kre62 subunit of glucan synthase n=1 Tax=Candida orthopsilosis (strain 90-125) TaxID=1136231 RepID=H8X8A6_CANO9|nr:Kre62 subunit of glucan synthase [Candida orthopsilosis Co 90-125]CCG24205.1 Kre62 subunit of glucan synthase [Candida orthopsilosis Co 90-125]